MKTKKILIFLGATGVLGGLVLFSGCGEKAENKNMNLNQEKVLNSQGADGSGKEIPTGVTNNDIVVQTPDPGNTVEGNAVKEVDAMLEGVSPEDYAPGSLDEEGLLSE